VDTYFAPARRTDETRLKVEIGMVSENPVVGGLLNSIGGLLAVLDANRQIVALNDSFLKMLGISDPGGILGLRPGEALRCVHADSGPAGCGTTEYCSTCGAAVAIVASLSDNRSVERLCALTKEEIGRRADLALAVRSQPIEMKGSRFLLLFMRDVSREQKLAALERTFFHDLGNMVTMLVGASDLLLAEGKSSMAHSIHKASLRLQREIEMQRLILEDGARDYRPKWETVPTSAVEHDLRSLFSGHPLAGEREVSFENRVPDEPLTTDTSALNRVLRNMLLNALEATEPGGSVKVLIARENGELRFSVWNPAVIPPDIQKRVFQRHFSTKDQPGRGIGTYSMRLLGEEILGGIVDFCSSPEEGTTFTFRIGARPIGRSVPDVN